jgi:ectoine hydroxylase-related dioxygenase (phytanoyl-CoA dioxygenase family)
VRIWIDIARRVAEAGSERLPTAVPIICAPGDVAITNRQTLHGSFANTSNDWRVTLNMGFHRRRSVLGVAGGRRAQCQGCLRRRADRQAAEMIGYAIDARPQRFPDERPFAYRPQAERGLRYVWDAKAKADIKDYNLNDLSI